MLKNGAFFKINLKDKNLGDQRFFPKKKTPLLGGVILCVFLSIKKISTQKRINFSGPAVNFVSVKTSLDEFCEFFFGLKAKNKAGNQLMI